MDAKAKAKKAGLQADAVAEHPSNPPSKKRAVGLAAGSVALVACVGLLWQSAGFFVRLETDENCVFECLAGFQAKSNPTARSCSGDDAPHGVGDWSLANCEPCPGGHWSPGFRVAGEVGPLGARCWPCGRCAPSLRH